MSSHVKDRMCFIRRAICLLSLIGAALFVAAPARAAEFEAEAAIVRLQPSASVQQFNANHGSRVLDQSPVAPVYLLQTQPGVNADAFCAAAIQDPAVVWAEPNLTATNPEILQQWISVFDGGGPGGNANRTVFTQIDFRTAGQIADGHGVTVAILDTGISQHPYLQGKIVPGWNVLNGSTVTDDVPNFLDDNGNGVVDEGTGHGTMVAGIVAQLAPNARLMPVKVLNSDGSGTLWELAEGVRWAVDHGARVLNMSLALTRKSDLLTEALEDAYTRGAVAVASAGNNNRDATQFPAGYSRLLTVAALNPDNTKAGFSNFGSTVDVCAPGIDIYSTHWDGRWATWSGTSFAAPFVTAEVALVWSVYPRVDNRKVQDAVSKSAHNIDNLNPLYKGKLGQGIIDVDRAVANSP